MIFKKTEKELYKEASKIALENAQMLYDEAKLLKENNYYARGFALGITSLEESVKALLFRAVSVDIFDVEKTRRFVRDHESKLEQSGQILTSLGEFVAMLIVLFKNGQERGVFQQETPISEDYRKVKELFPLLGKKIANSQNTKLDSLYVEVRGSTIINPRKVIKKEATSSLFHIVEAQNEIVAILINLENDQFVELCKIQAVAKIVSKIEEAMSRHFTRRKCQ
jgi:AbiV family abortive infection protein